MNRGLLIAACLSFHPQGDELNAEGLKHREKVVFQGKDGFEIRNKRYVQGPGVTGCI